MDGEGKRGRIKLKDAIITAVVIVGSLLLAGHTLYKMHCRRKMERIRARKGIEGEDKTFECLKNMSGYKKFLRNVYIPKGNGETVEVDILMIHQKGIFVIENKNYAGWIYGDEEDEKWCQIIGNKKHFFYNPIRQNASHIYWLERILEGTEYEDVECISVIVFNDSGNIGRISISDRKLIISQEHEITSKIKKASRRRKNQLKRYEIRDLYEYLMRNTGTKKEFGKQHKKQVQKKWDS